MQHITVAIPVFNRAHLIGETIQSVLNQDYQLFDLLVVDDGSSDNTVQVVSEFCEQDNRVRLVKNSLNLGLTRNWNRCIELAEGSLIQLLLSDDLMDPWGVKYVYRSPSVEDPERHKYDLYSYGPDRKAGGGDDIPIRDIEKLFEQQ